MPQNIPVRKVTASLDVLHFPAPNADFAEAICLNCSSPLTLSQPDLYSPERLIGVCDRCKHWYLVDRLPEHGEGIISRLPDAQFIRKLSRAGGGEEISTMMCGDAVGSDAMTAPADGPDTVPWEG